MSKRSSAKYKLDRRMGQNVWGRPKSPVNKREYGPGQHGQRRKQKLTDFGTQLGLVLESVDLAERDVPDYIEVDHSKMTARYARTPAFADVPYPVIMEP